MNKLFNRLFVLLLSGVLLTACGNQGEETPDTTEPDTEDVETEAPADEADDAEEATITIDIAVEGEEVADLSKEVVAPEGMYLLDIMKENYDIEETDGFIESIEGYSQDAEADIYWMFYVDGEMGEVGAAEYTPENADQIEWRLEGFE